ncbi:hypothetical protein AC579_7221 [Pseudocercospora musae]|uniref:Plastocyanin-like domain-containing protein n=1 Tax=Pseudocercospora musae TaxID=113226 RepID=A0A139IEZ3_9PEZI|nr:hypothetical protein AC579_7221 [Pseudocercospora musae]
MVPLQQFDQAHNDVDLGSVFLQEWDHDTASSLYSFAETNGPPPMDNGLINGTNFWEDGGSSGETNLLRHVNPSIDTFFDFSIDNHILMIMEADFVPATPFEVNIFGLQQYDVLSTTNQSSVASDFWLRAVPYAFCSAQNLHIYGDSNGTPTTDPWATDDSFLNCQDQPLASLLPVVPKNAGESNVRSNQRNVTIQLATGTNLFKWYLNNITFFSQWEDPTVLQIVNGDTEYELQQAVIDLPIPYEWMSLIIEKTNTAPHPINLHGHDFYILASTSRSYL